MTNAIQKLFKQLTTLKIAMEERDEYTAAHCDRTCELAVELGKSCGLSALELDLLRMAGAVHDLGKIGIPDHVLLKPGRLDSGEWQIMKSHAERSYHILSCIESDYLAPLADAVLHHHEAYDGSGYPDGLSGEEIPVMARIITLVDSYDAMATTRSYHVPRPHESIMQVLYEENASKYDPYLRNKFSSCIEHSSHKAAPAPA